MLTEKRPQRDTLWLFLTISVLLSGNARADYTVTALPTEKRGTWEGWGCNLSWWGRGIGTSAYESLYADLFFTRQTVSFFGRRLPGLGLNIVRYNIGGCGRDNVSDVIDGVKEKPPAELAWYKAIEGYWINFNSSDPATSNWDWSRDANQRSVLQAARDRGVNFVEFNANAPMWWMTYERTSAGGNFQAWNRRDFMRYLASVVKHAREHWGVKAVSIEPFNEPSAGWWKYPVGQEGCNIPWDQQAEMLGYLREELNHQGLQNVPIAASDENSVPQALATYTLFKGKSVSVDGKSQSVDTLIDRVNLHSYKGASVAKDNEARQQLRQLVGEKRVWMSEYADGDASGLPLAQTILADMNYLRPTAWIYWQPVEPYSGWGMVNGNYKQSATEPDRGKPYAVHPKYYVMAQFSRFLQAGFQIMGSNDNNSIVAYNNVTSELVIITLNTTHQRISYDLTGITNIGSSAAGTFTSTNGSALMTRFVVPVRSKRFSLSVAPNSIYSMTISNVTL